MSAFAFERYWKVNPIEHKNNIFNYILFTVSYKNIQNTQKNKTTYNWIIIECKLMNKESVTN